MFAMPKMPFITSIESGCVAVRLKYSLHKVTEKHQVKWNQRRVIPQIPTGGPEVTVGGHAAGVTHGSEAVEDHIAQESQGAEGILAASPDPAQGDDQEHLKEARGLKVSPGQDLGHNRGNPPQEQSHDHIEGIQIRQDLPLNLHTGISIQITSLTRKTRDTPVPDQDPGAKAYSLSSGNVSRLIDWWH